jgi:hypothetical protein
MRSSRKNLSLGLTLVIVIAVGFMLPRVHCFWIKTSLIESIDRFPEDWERGSHYMVDVMIWYDKAQKFSCFSELVPEIASRLFSKNRESRHRSFLLLLSIGSEAEDALPVLERGRATQSLTDIEREEVDYLIDAIRQSLEDTDLGCRFTPEPNSNSWGRGLDESIVGLVIPISFSISCWT